MRPRDEKNSGEKGRWRGKNFVSSCTVVASAIHAGFVRPYDAAQLIPVVSALRLIRDRI